LNRGTLIIHGPIGGGKTTRALELAERAREKGMHVMGVASLRVAEEGETVAYDGLNLASGARFPLVQLGERAASPDWVRLGPWKYAFSESGFSRANALLAEAAARMGERCLIVVDEYGHIEKLGRGLYPGLVKAVEALVGGGCLAVTCRTDKVDSLLQLLVGREQRVLVLEADRQDFWAALGDSFI
jgi:nucleoside-triphosphatase THEP1